MSQATGPHPVQVLIHLLNDPLSIEGVYQHLRRIYPSFPEGADSLCLWYFLWLAGLPVPYAGATERLILLLKSSRWRELPATEKPKAGDIYQLKTGQVGFVAKVSLSGDWFLATDARLADNKPRRQQIEEVAHWLRFG